MKWSALFFRPHHPAKGEVAAGGKTCLLIDVPVLWQREDVIGRVVRVAIAPVTTLAYFVKGKCILPWYWV
jgi:hypothetical protein